MLQSMVFCTSIPLQSYAAFSLQKAGHGKDSMLDNLPVFGCVLIGGKSTRLGQPKHLLNPNGKTWLEHTVDLLRQVTDQTIIVGAGTVPEGFDCTVLPDAHDAQGPMAGILAAMRWGPQSSWLVTACDLPALSVDALRWLLTTRAPGVWATLPKLPGKPNVEPLLAHYNFRTRILLEELARQGDFSLTRLAENPKVITPTPPADLAPAWQNVNTPEQLQAYLRATDPHA